MTALERLLIVGGLTLFVAFSALAVSMRFDRLQAKLDAQPSPVVCVELTALSAPAAAVIQRATTPKDASK